VTVRFDNLQQLIEEIERKPEETAAARREYEKRLTEVWKKPPRQQSALAFQVQSDVPIKDIAGALRYQCEPRRPGKPGGRHLRWQRQHYLVAWLVERGPTLPPEVCCEAAIASHTGTDELISHWINVINGWAFVRGKRPLDPRVGSGDHERVKMLLRGSKQRRL
jgi:hypothetical protein